MKRWQPGERAQALKDARAKHPSKVFDLRSAKDYSQAERFKARLENGGFSVTTQSVGLNRVRISGRCV